MPQFHETAYISSFSSSVICGQKGGEEDGVVDAVKPSNVITLNTLVIEDNDK